MALTFTFPLEGDPPGSPTLLTLQGELAGPALSGLTLVLGGPPDERLELPVVHRPAHVHSRAEVALADVGRFLGELALSAQEAGVVEGVFPWPFDVLRNDTWLMHVRQLVAIEGRLARARRSPVAQDPRVRRAIVAVTEGTDPHGRALEGWLAASRLQVKAVIAMLREEGHEQRVAAVLRDLAGTREDESDRPNPELPRLDGQVGDGSPV